MTNSHLLHELAGLFHDYEQENSEVLIHATMQFVSKVDPGVGELPTSSEIYAWDSQEMVPLPEEVAEKMEKI